MASTDDICGGNVEPRALEEEMRTAYLDYAMSVIVGRALPDVRDGLKPVHRRVLYAMNELGLGPTRSYAKCAQDRRRGDGQLSPARRLRDLRHARAHGAGVLDAQRARRRPGQLRLDRRRPGCRDALHRGEAGADRHRDAARPRHGHGRLRAQLRRLAPRTAGAARALPEPARQRLLGYRRRHGDEHPAAQPARGDRRDDRLHRRSGDGGRGPDAPHQGPGLPDGRDHPRPRRHQRRLRDRPRSCAHPGARAHRAAEAGQGGDRRHRAAVHGQEGWAGRPDRKDRRTGARKEDPRDLRPATTTRTSAGCA